MDGGDPPDPGLSFRQLAASGNKRKLSQNQQYFVKKLDNIPSVALPMDTCQNALNIADRGLIGQFTGLWPSPKTIAGWVQRNWKPLISEDICSNLIGKGYYLFLFENSVDRDLIFRNGPYFMGPQGLYPNKWTPDFDANQDIPSDVHVWVRFSHLSLHCWNSGSLEAIGNTLQKYIDRDDCRDQYTCARICVEVDLEVGLHEAINLTIADWSYVQELYYEQLPFKCIFCHGYGHFARTRKKKIEEEVDKEKGDQWTKVQKPNSVKKGNKFFGQILEMGTSSKYLGQN